MIDLHANRSTLIASLLDLALMSKNNQSIGKWAKVISSLILQIWFYKDLVQIVMNCKIYENRVDPMEILTSEKVF